MTFYELEKKQNLTCVCMYVVSNEFPPYWDVNMHESTVCGSAASPCFLFCVVRYGGGCKLYDAAFLNPYLARAPPDSIARKELSFKKMGVKRVAYISPTLSLGTNAARFVF